MKNEEKLLIQFFIFTFAIGWFVPGSFLLIAKFSSLSFSFEEGSLLSLVSIWSPAISAFITITLNYDFKVLLKYLKKIIRVEGHWGWFLGLLFFFPLISLISSLLLQYFTGKGFSFPSLTLKAFMFAILVKMIGGPIEEIGWRGFALPLLQRNYSGLVAAVIIGCFWALWHVPAFFISSVMTGSLTGHIVIVLIRFFIGVTATSIFLTILYNGTGGCIVATMLYHWIMNLPYPWESKAGISMMQDIVSVIIVIIILFSILRKKYLEKKNLATEVIQNVI